MILYLISIGDPNIYIKLKTSIVRHYSFYLKNNILNVTIQL